MAQIQFTKKSHLGQAGGKVGGRWGRALALILCAILSTHKAHSANGSSSEREDEPAATGELIIKIKNLTNLREVERTRAALSRIGVEVLRPMPAALGDVAVYRVRNGGDIERALHQVKNLPMIAYATPNYLYGLHGVSGRSGVVPAPPSPKPPLKPRPAQTLPPVADPDLRLDYGLGSMRVGDAWATARGDSSMVVAVIDTGVDYNHEDLAFNMWRNPNPSAMGDVVGFDPGAKDGLPYDDDKIYGHGTHAAGIIGAVWGNGRGTAGVNQQVSIMAIKGLSGNGFAWSEYLISGIVYAVDHGAKIISASWANAKKDNPPMIDALNYAASKGVLFVVAAGNSAGDDDNDATAEYPAGYIMDHLLAVASVDENDQLAPSSNYGAKTVGLAAPGVNIYSTLPENRYGFESGTSMACPAAAGAAALVWSKYPKLTNVQVKKALMDSVDLAPSLAGKTVTGGRVNVAKALAAAKAMVTEQSRR